MFNQKVNGFTSQNPDYLNYSMGALQMNPYKIHTCGTNLEKFMVEKPCESLPLQTWCSKHVAVESFAMRPIVNSKEYFENISKYLASIVYTDAVELKQSELSKEKYKLFTDYGNEPDSSFLQTINLEVTDKLTTLMSASSDQVSIFKDYNPLCEGFVITDMDIVTYRSIQNNNHFFHRVLFTVFNTTRYNSISLKAELYQNTDPMMNNWNEAISEVKQSKDLTKGLTDVDSVVYVSLLQLSNNTNCVLGDESECAFKGYTFSGYSQNINDNYSNAPSTLDWLQPNAIAQNTYTNVGNYSTNGNISIIDYGPDNLDTLVKNLI
jgi:hypothetical protein